MVWYTYLTGLALFGIGIACRFLVQLTQWQALLPVVFGLFYITMAEGMRSTPTRRRLFQFLALLWSMVIMVIAVPYAKELGTVWNHGAVIWEGMVIKPEMVQEYAAVLAVALAYFIIAGARFWRWSAK
jgi:hypothetical protein